MDRTHQKPPTPWGWRQRWATGLLLGLIWATVLGALAPWVAHPAQGGGAEAGHWAQPCVTALGDRYTLPDQRNGIAPTLDSAATWGEAITLLTQALPRDIRPYPEATPLERALGLPSPANPLHTYPATYFQPQRPLARAEAITALAARLQLPYVARSQALLRAGLEDGDQIPAYGQEGVAAALAAGRLVNYPTATQLRPQAPISRGELAALVCQASGDPRLQGAIAPQWIPAIPALPAPVSPQRETRGVWLTNIDSEVLFSQANLAAGVERLQQLHFNTLYPVVWNGGYTLYPSALGADLLGQRQRLFPGNNPAFEAAQGDRDPLQELIDLAQTAHMAVIPWFEFGFMAPPQATYPLRQQHPDWFTQRRDGSQEDLQGGEAFVWMNPFHPQVQQLLLALVAEVLDTYPVDGIQFDDHLGLPVAMGYDPYTVALYRREHGGADPPADESDPEWVQWRSQKITTFVEALHRLVKSKRPDAIVSISPNPYPFAYERYLQDWPTWERRGLLDELVVQIYRDGLDRFAWELTKPVLMQARRRVSVVIGLLSGLRGRPMAGELLTTQLTAVRDRGGYGGVAYFFYETLWVPGSETPEERLRQFQANFPVPALRAPRGSLL